MFLALVLGADYCGTTGHNGIIMRQYGNSSQGLSTLISPHERLLDMSWVWHGVLLCGIARHLHRTPSISPRTVLPLCARERLHVLPCRGLVMIMSLCTAAKSFRIDISLHRASTGLL